MNVRCVLLPVVLCAIAPRAFAGDATQAAADFTLGSLNDTLLAPPTPQRSYKLLPEDEDWRWLKAPHVGTDLFDPIKYVPLTPKGDLSLSIGGSSRIRFEDKINPGFGAYSPTANINPTKNDDYTLYRWYLHTDIRYTDLVRVFIEGNGGYIDGYRRNPPPTPFPSDRADLHQAFLDVSPLNKERDGLGLTLRLGRQELSFDAQKLVGTLDWANVRRTYDGGSILAQFDDFQADFFWVRPVIVDDIHFNSEDEETNFAGFHFSHPLFDKNNHFSFFTYYLNRSRNTSASFKGGVANFNPDAKSGDTDRVTIGSRFWGGFDHFDYDAEGGVQVGRFGGEEICPAGYVSAETGYTFADLWAKPRLAVGYDYASGDDGRNGHAGTFDQLFPTGHLYFGYLDFVGRQNIDSAHVTLAVNPVKPLKLWATWHYFALADAHDALYNASGQAIRFSSSGAAGSDVGNELDLTASYQLGRHLSFLVGYGVFFPGDFINNTGTSQTAQMVYTSMEFKF